MCVCVWIDMVVKKSEKITYSRLKTHSIASSKESLLTAFEMMSIPSAKHTFSSVYYSYFLHSFRIHYTWLQCCCKTAHFHVPQHVNIMSLYMELQATRNLLKVFKHCSKVGDFFFINSIATFQIE